MGRHREWWEGIRGHGQGQGAVGGHTGPWVGSGSGWEAYGPWARSNMLYLIILCPDDRCAIILVVVYSFTHSYCS